MDACQQKRAASLVAVIAASIAFVVVVAATVAAVASALAAIVALTERFVVVLVSVAAEEKPVTVDYDPGIAWDLVSEESVV